jgi:hypothetical protein
MSSDCHQLDIEQATASILDRSRRRRLLRQIDESATGGDDDDDANEDRQLFDELRRRFNSNRTFVLCKPMRSPSAENRSPVTQYSKITGDRPHHGRHKAGAADGIRPESAASIEPGYASTAKRGNLRRHRRPHDPEYTADIRTNTGSSIVSRHRRRDGTTPNPEDSLGAFATDVAFIDDIQSPQPPPPPPPPFAHHRRRHSRARNRREHDRFHETHRAVGGKKNGLRRYGDAYFTCGGRRHPSTSRYFRHLERAMRARTCWSADDEKLAADVHRRLLATATTAQESRAQSDSDDISRQLQQQCRLQQRYETCRRALASKFDGSRPTPRRGISGAPQRGLPYSWSQQVSDIMSTRVNESMIFY